MAKRHSLACLVSLLAVPTTVYAQTRSFNIESAEVIRVIPEFARQAGIQIIAPSKNLRGVTSPAIKGTFNVRDALRLLLKDTGLEIALDDGDVVTLRAVQNDAAKRVPLDAPPDIRKAALPRTDFVPDPPQLAEIVVTGTRIIRDGYQSPTPVTVVGTTTLQEAAKANIADILNELPSFHGSTAPRGNGMTNLQSTTGANILNLRGMGETRTLVLFDGRRFVPAFNTGVVDVNQIPDALVSRVDIVTGGASAAYGSDALTGVVNYVLDNDFTGVKGSIMGGVTARGDGQQYKIQVAAGFPISEGKGHVLISGDKSYEARVRGVAREWNQLGYVFISNPAFTPTNGLPSLIARFNVGLAEGYPGGIISGGPLKGTAFGPGGAPFLYNYGEYVSASHHVGGDWETSSMNGAADLSPLISSEHFYAHAAHDLDDNTTLFVEAGAGFAFTDVYCCYQYYLGNLTASTDNPYLPASIAASARAQGLSSFPYGITIREPQLPPFGAKSYRMNHTYAIGAKGSIEALSAKWSWNAALQRGIAKTSQNSRQATRSKFANAIDAVRAPNGSITCRINLTDPNANCVPFNLFGTNVNSSSAVESVLGLSHLSARILQDVVSLDVRGEPFGLLAGNISLAAGFEYRRDAIFGVPDAASIIRDNYSTNFTGFEASGNVAEGYVESVIPLARNWKWASAWDLNAATRFTAYSSSGFVTTWKVGTTFSPSDSLRFRFTQSRDIRAPNLNELFAPPTAARGSLRDPFMGNATVPQFSLTVGNPELSPEKADTTGFGVIYRSDWLSGLTTSVDFYRIRVSGVIDALTGQDVLDQCFAGIVSICDNINRTPNGVLDTIILKPLNQNARLATGMDIEASYSNDISKIVPSWSGMVAVRLLATRAITNSVDNGIILSEQVGAQIPKWTLLFSASYATQALRLTWIGRFIGAGKISDQYLECTAACPRVPPNIITVDHNRYPAYFKSNLAVSYSFYRRGSINGEFFVTVDNVFDKDPPLIPQTGLAFSPITNSAFYDKLGRSFRSGFRFRM